MAVKQTLEAQNPLILRSNRLIEAFAKSDDERDFYLDRLEGFIFYADLDKPEEELNQLEKELGKNSSRYCLIPKLTFYETKKIMEGFINEKVYDIDTKEKMLDIIQSKEARENFIEFIYDHHAELEKWQSYYQERSRVRIIEWLRANNINFVFEEDLEFPKFLLEKIKKELFQAKAGKDVLAARKILVAKAKTYYSNEALNPRPKRGRPPKQIQKAEIEPQITTDIFTTVPNGLRSFLFIPDYTASSVSTFSAKFGYEEGPFSHKRPSAAGSDVNMENLQQKLAALRSLSSKWRDPEDTAQGRVKEVDQEEIEIEKPMPERRPKPSRPPAKGSAKRPAPAVSAAPSPKKAGTSASKKKPSKAAPAKQSAPKKASKAPAKPAPKSSSHKKQKALRPIMKLKKKR